MPAADAHAQKMNDDNSLESDDPKSGNGNVQHEIKQDKDLEPPVFDDISHQSTSNLLYDQLVGHSWQAGGRIAGAPDPLEDL